MAYATELRRHLHRNPELGFEEENTAALIRSQLDNAGIPWRSVTKTGTVATIKGQSDKPHIALRGDIDALPIAEQGQQDWCSTQAGKMHACGHDGHTATLMAAALWINAHREGLENTVSFVFQPAEEGLHGAKAMIENGALDGIDMIYGWHNWPAIPFGKAICPNGPVMSANGGFEIKITGKGGHSSQPDLCCDPVLAGAAITMNLQQILSRKIQPQTPAVVSVTSFEAPSGLTVIPEYAHLGGSIRVANTAMRDEVFTMMDTIVQNTAHSYGVTAEMIATPRYGATVNHPEQAENMRKALHGELGKDWFDPNCPSPIMASEDFSYYLEEIPGAFALVGADDGISEHQKPCHSPHYDFNDKLIPVVVRVFSRLVGVQPT